MWLVDWSLFRKIGSMDKKCSSLYWEILSILLVLLRNI